MKVLIIYKPNSEYARDIESFIHDFKSRHETGRMEVLDANTRDGNAMGLLYDVMRFPAILALRDDGSVMKSWEGNELPTMDELSYYTFQHE